MKQELMKFNSDDEMQERWKSCVKITCYAFDRVERLIEAIKVTVEQIYEAVRQIINSFVEAFKPMVESFYTCFRDLKEEVENLFIKCDTYPQTYPPIVYNLKVNTKGFPRPIIHCARSRC